MFYDRKVKYLNYYESGEVLKGSGFLKVEMRDKVLRWEMSVKGAGDISGSFPILFVGEKEVAVAELELKRGDGNLRHECHAENDIASSGITYDRWRGVRIPLAEGKEIACFWEPYGASARKEERTYAAERGLEPVEEEKEASVAEKAIPDWRETESDVLATGNAVRSPRKAEPADTSNGMIPKVTVKEERNLHGSGSVHRSRREEPPVRGQFSAEKNLSETCREDKWTQLCAIYPHINPFRDEREYLSISPADFVLFPEKDYKAVHNSFLLHGYYNYKHLILTRMEQRGENLYYVGVPGNYCEREKQVAVMFRFESFECASEPAEYGDFGYYMMRVNL